MKQIKKDDLTFLYQTKVNNIVYDFMINPADHIRSAWEGNQLICEGRTSDMLMQKLIFREPIPKGVNIL